MYATGSPPDRQLDSFRLESPLLARTGWLRAGSLTCNNKNGPQVTPRELK